MKRLLIGTFACCATALAINAQDVDGRKGLSKDDAKARQSVIEKYDSNQDGVLDRGEQRNMSKEDKKTLAKTGGVGTSRKPPKASDQDGERKHDREKDGDHDGHEKAKGDKDGKAHKSEQGGKGKGGKK